jgi:glycosyltransferase involved in cell wall biosynthesis
MKVLILSQYFWPEAFRINEVVGSLLSNGCDVTVLTGQPNYPGGDVFNGYRAVSIGSERHPAGYTIHRVPLCPRGKGSALRLVANYLSFVASASLLGPWLLRRQKFDVIFVYGISPILQALPGIALKVVKGAKLVTWVQDLWPQSLEATGFVRNRHVLAMVAVVVRWIYRRSDLLLVQSQAFIPTVQAMARNIPVEYHPNPGEMAFGQSRPEVKPALLLEPGFNVIFAGNLGTVQALDTVLDAAEILQAHKDVRLVLIGRGARLEWLQRQIAQRGLTNVCLPGGFQQEAMPEILAQASALLVSLARSPILSQTVPSKIQAYLAAGRPIIASLDGEGARVIEEAGAGIACAAEDPAALAKAVLSLRASSREHLLRMGGAGRVYYERHFDPSVLAQKLMKRFQDITSGQQPRHAG